MLDSLPQVKRGLVEWLGQGKSGESPSEFHEWTEFMNHQVFGFSKWLVPVDAAALAGEVGAPRPGEVLRAPCAPDRSKATTYQRS